MPRRWRRRRRGDVRVSKDRKGKATRRKTPIVTHLVVDAAAFDAILRPGSAAPDAFAAEYARSLTPEGPPQKEGPALAEDARRP